jgi:hypothetical protein
MLCLAMATHILSLTWRLVNRAMLGNLPAREAYINRCLCGKRKITELAPVQIQTLSWDE